MRLWESNSLAKRDHLRSVGTRQSPVATQENPHHRGHRGHSGAQGKVIRSPTQIAYNSPSMTVAVRSFAKINLGLYIGAARADGFHDLRTVYQTIALHDVIRVSVGRGSGIEILCKNKDPRVPLDSSNTCYRMAERVLDELGAKGRVSVEIEKRLPVKGGLGAASSNAVATMVALERALRKKLSGTARLRIAAEVARTCRCFW